MLSVALIVKNEKDHIRTALASVASADEIVVCDTGSSDDTVEIAREFTDKVFTDYQWADHFADARNYALSKCSGEWVLSIDADEVLEEGGIEKVRAIIASATPDQKTFSVKMVHGAHTHHLARLFRNDGSVKWVGRAHETLSPPQENRIDVTITYGYSTAHKLDPDRMLRILQKAVEEHPESARDIYYLGREYWYRKDYEKASELFDKAATLSRWTPEKADAYLYSARCYFQLSKGDTARERCLRAIQTNPDFGEALRFMSDLHFEPWKSKWKHIADHATDKDVLFHRAISKTASLPLDMKDTDILAFKNILSSFGHVDVLEWGAGNSTRYFTKFMRDNGISYTWEAVEHDKGWYEEVQRWALPDVSIHLAERDTDEYYNRKGKYDVIFIDGRNRRKCLLKAKELLREGGIVLLHDADRDYYQCAFEGYEGRFLSPRDAQPRLWAGRLEKKPLKIPNIIHQIWIGPKKAPTVWMNTWREKNPDFEYILWDERRLSEFGLKNKDIYDRYYADGCFNGCANVARAEILKAMGGVYIDADSVCETPLSEGPFMNWDIFSVYEADNFYVEGVRLIANGIIGCVPNHPVMTEYVKRLGELRDIHPSWKRSGPFLWSQVLRDEHACLPPYTFLPEHHSGHKNKVDGVIYARQFWGTSKNIYV